MFIECKKKLHSNGSMVQTFPKLIPYSSAEAACPRRKSKLGIPPGHRVCRFPDCGKNPCQHGWCEETMQNFKCHCSAGYRGKLCDRPSATSREATTNSILDSATPNPTTTTTSATSREATTNSLLDSTTPNPTINTKSTSTQDTTTMSTAGSTASRTITATPSATSREATTNSILDSATPNPTTTTKTTTPSQDTTTMIPLEPTTSHPTTTTPSATSREATTNSLLDSTTPNPTINTKSTSTQDTTTMSTAGSTTSRTTTATPSATSREATTNSILDSATPNRTTTTTSATSREATTNSILDSTTPNPTTTTKSTTKIFVTGENGIFVADPQDDLDFTKIQYSTDENPRYITYDSVKKKVYWTDKNTKKVYRADVDGGHREEVTSESGDDLRGIAIAEKSRTLYIANKSQKKITSVSIAQESSDKTDFTSLCKEPYSLEVDEEKGFLYWSIDGEILRKPLNGSGSVETIYCNEDISKITGLSIDLSRDPRRVFFFDSGTKRRFSKDVNRTLTAAYEHTDNGALEKLRDIRYFNGALYRLTEDSPSVIRVVKHKHGIKQTSMIREPFQLLIINVNP